MGKYMTKLEAISQIKDLMEKFPRNYSQVICSKKYQELKETINSFLPNFNKPEVLMKTKIYALLHDINDFPVCKICGKKIINISNQHFNRFCSRTCQAHDTETQAKREKTNLERYGTNIAAKSEQVKEKAKQSCLQKYGTEYVMQAEGVKQKTKANNMAKYGVQCTLNLPEIREKAKQSYQENKDIIQVKIENTVLKKYGVKNAAQSPIVKLKIKATAKKKAYNKLLNDPLVIPLFSLDEFIKTQDGKLKWKCKLCGREFIARINENWYSQGKYRSYVKCEKCFPRLTSKSNAESEISEYLQKLLKQDVEIIRNTRRVISPKELDIYIPAKRLAIEYDGLYHHSENVGKPKDFHIYKTRRCKEKGIRLIHIFEDEWIHSKDIVKNRLAAILGVYEKKIGARICTIKMVGINETENFLNENHIQGSCRSSVNIGLYYQNQLVSLMTFGKPRFSRKYDWELLRFCTYKNWHVIGAAGKLLKYFIQNYKPETIISYCDLRWSTGTLYETLGFTLDHQSAPNYWYFKLDKIYKRMHRSKFMKSKLKNILDKFDPNLSESENMFNNKYYKIYDCGNLVYVLRL